MFLSNEEIKKLKQGVQHRLTIDGKTESFQSYLVLIDGLFFNDLNGRISTYIEENNNCNDSSQNLKKLLTAGKLELYNDMIADFIKKSANDNDASYKKTKNDIRLNGQKIPGVILKDGRIIDGNRRFTCLRELYKETGDTKFAYFECVILDVPETKEQMRSIKLLELNIQFNVDEKKDYNRIDFLVSFYKDTMDSSSEDRIDKKTYCYASGLSESDYNTDKLIVETMLDYLEWRKKAKAFYILKNEKLDGPIEEIAKKRKKWTKDEWDEMKNTIYSYMTFNNTGDRTRDLRKILDSANKGDYLYKHLKEKIENTEFIVKLSDALDTIGKKPTSPEESKEKSQLFLDVQNPLVSAFNEGVLQESIQKDAEEPKKAIKSALDSLTNINQMLIYNFSQNKKDELIKYIENIKDALAKLEEICKK